MPLGTHIDSTDPLRIGSDEAFWETHAEDLWEDILHETCSPPTDDSMRKNSQRAGILCSSDIEACLPPPWPTENEEKDNDSSFWREKLTHDLARRFNDGSSDMGYDVTTNNKRSESSVSIPKALLEIRSSRIIVLVSGVVWGIIETADETAELLRDVWQRIWSGWLTREQERLETEYRKDIE